MGSAVPHITKDGLQGIQEPLKELYPEQGALGARGIDSWLSVWSNGLLLENVDENHKKVTRFFPIESLHYCAAVRYVLVPEKASNNPSTPKFLPLDSPFARTPNPSHPPLFAAILRRVTGIKVLECHAFICKREMAANALVRCCFHAYADSSYAKHIDEKSSLYGTLRNHNQTNDAIDRVEVWRQASKTNSKNGSTTTLNSHNGNIGTLRSIDQMTLGDDISVYNGDENHKVWAGLSANDNIYGDSSAGYGSSTMRMGKSIRPRQALTPAPPPPPPPLKEEKKKVKKEQEKKRKKYLSESRDNIGPMVNGSLMRHAQSVNNLNMRPPGGMKLAPQPIYSNGTIMRPNGYGSGSLPNGYPPNTVMYIPTTLPNHGGKKKTLQHAGTFSHRPKNMMPFSHKSMPPHFMPVTPPVPMIPFPGKKVKNIPQHMYAMEEPLYMPSSRPLSPVASYQPGHFPHESYLMQQYATMDNGKKKKGRKNKMAMAVPVPIPTPMPPNGTIYMGNHGLTSSNGQGPIDVPYSPMANGNHSPPNEESLVGTSPDNDEESPFNTGIYRKKGHLNERAFSYSIRQEHRSRSYGSLANLKFSTPMHNGGGSNLNVSSKVESKKEREIMQMMQDLDLSGDELERSEVPKAVYESKRLAAVAAGASDGKARR
ncbi:hypothetical protein RUM44_013901 [Polyplax serrata]|uniref:PID domain-containing protein n=1 Tax=Polyplax serrata TaxID=468196 RepID=A0ABR1BFF8_POLSC